METHTIQAAPCPICGDTTFAWETYPDQPDNFDAFSDEVGDPRLAPRECSTCGNVQVVATR